jgi:hypothetical protein
MKEVRCDTTKWGILHLDNVQQYVHQRDLWIGWENKMNIGIGATYFKIELDNKLAPIVENKQKDLTVEQLLSWIDQEHLEMVSVLH